MSGLAWLVSGTAKGAFLLVLAWTVARLPIWSAAQRHALLTAALFGQIAVFAFAALLPGIPIPLPEVFERVRPVSASWWSGPEPGPHGAFAGGNTPVGTARTHGRGGHVEPSPARGTNRAPSPRGTVVVPDLGRAPTAHPGGPTVATWGLLAWAAGSLVLLIGLLTSTLRARRWALGAQPLRDRRWRTELEHSRISLGLDARVRLVTRRDVTVPACLVAGGPIIVLPADAPAWPATRRRAILLHELAHLKRRDPLTRTLGRAVRALLWPNPLVWIACREAATEAERACDDAVLHAGTRPSAYVSELVAFARRAGCRAPAATSLVARTSLERRARALLAPHARRAPAGLATAVLVGTGVAVTAAGLAPLRATSAVHDGSGAERHGGDAIAFPACPYAGGALRNRFLPTDQGARVWEVDWGGDECRVRLLVRSTAPGPTISWLAQTGAAGVRLEPAAAGGSVEIEITGSGGELELTLVRGDDARVHREVRSDGQVRAYTPDVEAWLDAFTLEVDRLTGFAVAARLPELLDRGGVLAVLSEAALAGGDHAPGIYLHALLRAQRLEQPQLERLLHLAAERVTNEAVLVELLGEVARGYDLRDPGVAAAFATARVNLRTRAGREAVPVPVVRDSD